MSEGRVDRGVARGGAAHSEMSGITKSSWKMDVGANTSFFRTRRPLEFCGKVAGGVRLVRWEITPVHRVRKVRGQALTSTMTVRVSVDGRIL